MFKCNTLLLLIGACGVFSQGIGSGTDGKLRVCVVEGRRASDKCPVLERGNAVECVLGTDRLDCLRRLGKGIVDFGVFNPEDLIAADWAKYDVLVTDELRKWRDRQYEKTIVAVVSKDILRESSTSVRAILKNVSLCHAGLPADDRGLNDILAKYLEFLVTDRTCDADLSMTENRIHALASYFGKSCRAGDWSPDKALDGELKSRYKSLCAACQHGSCAQDAYYGDVGALNCLVSGGQLTWQQPQTVQAYFQRLQDYESEGYAYLCRDGSWQSLANNTRPCVWLQVPWPVVVAKKKSATAVAALTDALKSDINRTGSSWIEALAEVLEVQQAPVSSSYTPTDYLSRATGFTEAYGQTGCTPSRHITICTASNVEHNKCTWLAEAGAVFGVQPAVQCARRGARGGCLAAVGGEVDVTVADSDWLVEAQRDYSVMPLLHETTPIIEQMSNVVAYVKRDANILSMADLRGKRAAFPRFDGYAWHTVGQYLSENKNECRSEIMGYFSKICAPGTENLNDNEIKDKLTMSCADYSETKDSEQKALRALVEDKADVAFVSMSTFKKYSGKVIPDAWAHTNEDIIPICAQENQKYCFISWSSLGHVYTSKNITAMRRQEIIDVFEKLDQLLGKDFKSHLPMFRMYGPYNDAQDVMFHNNTRKLATSAIFETHPYDKIPMSFERGLVNFTFSSCGLEYLKGGSWSLRPTFLMIFALVSFIVLH